MLTGVLASTTSSLTLYGCPTLAAGSSIGINFGSGLAAQPTRTLPSIKTSQPESISTNPQMAKKLNRIRISLCLTECG
ncbi:hypothetical protein PSEUDO8AS_110055 [Pseudomonas sp. 8AS]|nr:hypothetical protein PSEUDO8AS_110055 [Pseudomonas sp. 8AS]